MGFQSFQNEIFIELTSACFVHVKSNGIIPNRIMIRIGRKKFVNIIELTLSRGFSPFSAIYKYFFDERDFLSVCMLLLNHLREKGFP